jgi:hypothetical protein
MNEFFIILVALLVVIIIINRNRCEETETFAGNITKTWDVVWTAGTGSIMLMVGNNQALHLNIRDDRTVMSAWDGSRWGPDVWDISQFHNNNRNRDQPLRFKIIFNTANGFTINYQDKNIATYPNKFNITNADDLKPRVTSGINVSELETTTQTQTQTQTTTTMQAPTTTTTTRSIEKLNNTNCVWGRISEPGASGTNYKYLGDFDTLEQCAASPNIDANAKAITIHGNNSGAYSRQCYSINDKNTRVTNQTDTTCGIISSVPVVQPPTTQTQTQTQASTTTTTRSIEKLNNTNCVWGRISGPGASGSDYKYIGDFDTLEQCAASPNIDANAKAITHHGTNSGAYSRQCYSINDKNTRVTNQTDTTCGIINSVPVAQQPISQFQKLDKTNCVLGLLSEPKTSGSNYKYLGEFDTYDLCAQSPNIDANAKAIIHHGIKSGAYFRQCYSINDINTDNTYGIRKSVLLEQEEAERQATEEAKRQATENAKRQAEEAEIIRIGKWNVKKGMSSSGPKYNRGYRSLEQCKIECKNDRNCAGFQIWNGCDRYGICQEYSQHNPPLCYLLTEIHSQTPFYGDDVYEKK